jgi:hypothetical protein
MVKKSKLFAALDAHKGRDYEKERQKKLAKTAEKKKKAQKGDSKEVEEVCCSPTMQYNWDILMYGFAGKCERY